MKTYITEVHDAQLSECADDLSSDLVGDIELGQGHVRRAEQRILMGSHLARRAAMDAAQLLASFGGGDDGEG